MKNLFFLIPFLLSPLTLQAAPPLFPESIPADHPPFCRVNGEAVKRRIAALKASPQFVSPISASTYTVLVIRVDFSDAQAAANQRSNAESIMASVRNFHLENSYGLISTSITVTNRTSGGSAGAEGAYRMTPTLATYAQGLCSNYDLLAQNALAAAATDYTLSSFNHAIIYHAGVGAETTGDTGCQTDNIWSAYSPTSYTIGSKTFPGATFVPESETGTISPLGVIAHEYGHQLGAVDLYNTQTGATVIGSWSLMDAGVYLGSPLGSNPAHMDAWHKLYLGIASPETITLANNAGKTLTQASTSRSSFLRLPITVSSVGGDNEYFLLEYRRTSASNGASYDQALKGSGLLIWHVDDSIASNATRVANNNVNVGTPNLGVDLIEADSTDASSNSGDATDPWPGPTVTFQSPKARAFNGGESGISVSDIATGGAASISMKVNATIFPVPTSDSVGVGNTGTDGYTNPSKGDLVRITLHPKASGTVNLKVYNLNGDLVYETSVQATAGISQTPTWSAKNTGGKTVASGIYVLHVEGGGIDSTKKIAIIK